MKIRHLIQGLLLALALPAALAEERPSDYARQLPLSLSGAGPWYRMELPVTLHLAARHADLRDLRVFNGAGEPLAYALKRGALSQGGSHQHWSVKPFPLYAEQDLEQWPNLRVQRSASGTLVEVLPEPAAPGQAQVLRGWLLDASEAEAPLHGLILDWHGEEQGFQRFSIEASDDLLHWRSWGEGQIARLSFDGERIEQRELALPGQSARYLRLLWRSPQQAPQLRSAQVRSSTGAVAALSWSPGLAPSRVGPGEYHWELPLSLPLQRLRLELPPANSLLPVRVSGRREGGRQWQPLGQGLLYRLNQEGQELRQDELALSGAPVGQLRLQIDARGGGLGSAAPLLQVGVEPTQVVFLARGEPPYVLAVGKAAGQAGDLPLSTLIPGYQPERLAGLAVASLAAEAAAPTPPAPPGPDWQRWGLWAVLLAGVGLLLLMAASLLRNRADAA